jgi:hypothetical protein
VSAFGVSYIVLWIVVLFETLVLLLVFREIGLMYMARRESFVRDGPTLGAPIPEVEAFTPKGDPRGREDLRAPVTALVFGAFGCQLCAPVVHKIERWAAWVPGLTAVLVAERAELRVLPRDVVRLSSEVWVVGKGEVKKRFGVRASPYVVLVDDRGIALAKGIVNHHSDINRLLSEVRDRSPRLFPVERGKGTPASTGGEVVHA